ncbi:hypothetical protein PR048_032498 [Dryococelus australis]|uniref:Uncharacterized protein n=1 Tax=Dryococelus australis TaxID=614101 RepID=A0ABQ9G5I7_9NEOP|nr:hypothetical protein PR048_032498 [Dryococelus australis]
MSASNGGGMPIGWRIHLPLRRIGFVFPLGLSRSFVTQELCRTTPLVGGFSRVSLAFRRCCILTSLHHNRLSRTPMLGGPPARLAGARAALQCVRNTGLSSTLIKVCRLQSVKGRPNLAPIHSTSSANLRSTKVGLVLPKLVARREKYQEPRGQRRPWEGVGAGGRQPRVIAAAATRTREPTTRRVDPRIKVAPMSPGREQINAFTIDSQVRFSAGSLPDFHTDDAAGQQVFSEISRFPRPCIPALLHAHLTSPSSAFKTSMFRSVQISSHSHVHQHALLPVAIHGEVSTFESPLIWNILGINEAHWRGCGHFVIHEKNNVYFSGNEAESRNGVAVTIPESLNNAFTL